MISSLWKKWLFLTSKKMMENFYFWIISFNSFIHQSMKAEEEEDLGLNLKDFDLKRKKEKPR